jgi:CBS domain-containing protein
MGGPGREYGGMDDYGRGRYGERAEYRYDERRYNDDARRRESGRSMWDDARDSVREAFTRRPEPRSGATRSHLRCRDIMTRDVTCATRGSTLQEVARMMRDEDTGVIPVVDPVDESAGSRQDASDASRRMNARPHSNGKLVGLITDRDIVVRAVAEGKDISTRAEEIMTTDIHTARPNDRVIEVIRKMGDKQVRRIPVVDDNGNLVGIISMADVALETENDRELAEALEEISSGASFWSKMFG